MIDLTITDNLADVRGIRPFTRAHLTLTVNGTDHDLTTKEATAFANTVLAAVDRVSGWNSTVSLHEGLERNRLASLAADALRAEQAANGTAREKHEAQQYIREQAAVKRREDKVEEMNRRVMEGMAAKAAKAREIAAAEAAAKAAA